MSVETQQCGYQGPSGGAIVAGYVLAAGSLGLLAFAAWTVLAACGLKLFGTEYRFGWCDAKVDQVAVLRVEEARNRLLQQQIHDLELAVMTPGACGPAVEEQRAERPAQCEPGQAEVPPPSEVALILDGSGSMEYSVNLPEDLELQSLRLYERMRQLEQGGFRNVQQALELQQLRRRAARLHERLLRVAGPSRARVAKQVLNRAVEDAPNNLDMDLTVFSDCNDIKTSNFSSSQRPGLINTINRMRPVGATPIATSMMQAARNLENGTSLENPAYMVLVTDGGDSCGGDPCAAARQLSQQLPGLIINVIDLSQTNQLQCVADITGGRYRRARGTDSDLFAGIVRDAAGYGDQPTCRPIAPLTEDAPQAE